MAWRASMTRKFFGTDGIRYVLTSITPELALKVGQAALCSSAANIAIVSSSARIRACPAT